MALVGLRECYDSYANHCSLHSWHFDYSSVSAAWMIEHDFSSCIRIIPVAVHVHDRSQSS